jgi:hypothetical protein
MRTRPSERLLENNGYYQEGDSLLRNKPQLPVFTVPTLRGLSEHALEHPE